MSRALPAVIAAALGLALLSGCAASGEEAGPSGAPEAVTGENGPAVKTALPGLAAAVGDPELPSFADARPGRGEVELASGPFDDRFAMTGLKFDGAAVSGTVTITSDVSDLLDLMVQAGFYDADGELLGTASFQRHHEESGAHADADAGPPNESERFRIRVPEKFAGVAVSAAVGVPVLVNE